MIHTPPTDMPPISNALYIVATPIGNLWDITYRAVAVLSAVDVIFCEDTRTSAKLLSAFGISTKTLSYHDHNGKQQRPKILDMLNKGKSIALISDAGTPLINDPGYKLTDMIITQGHTVIPIPGVSAPLTALMGAGMPSDIFTYIGFLPSKTTAKKAIIQGFCHTQGTIITFDSPRRLPDTLRCIGDIHPTATVGIARELTKKFEQFARFKGADITDDIINSIPKKGECVVLIRLPKPHIVEFDIPHLLRTHMQHSTLKNAVQVVTDITGQPKKSIYKQALKIKNES